MSAQSVLALWTCRKLANIENVVSPTCGVLCGSKVLETGETERMQLEKLLLGKHDLQVGHQEGVVKISDNVSSSSSSSTWSSSSSSMISSAYSPPPLPSHLAWMVSGPVDGKSAVIITLHDGRHLVVELCFSPLASVTVAGLERQFSEHMRQFLLSQPILVGRICSLPLVIVCILT